MPNSRERVYVDTCVFFNVLKEEEPYWRDAAKVLQAAARGDIELAYSTLTIVELSGWHGDVDPSDQRNFVERYLRGVPHKIPAELDPLIADQTADLARRYHLRGADAAHLATALRLNADYFMSNDKKFPYGTTVESTRVLRPAVVWDPTIFDELSEASSVE